MSAAAPPFIVEHAGVGARRWKRFLASLCLMEFYVLLVHAGTVLVTDHSTTFSALAAAVHGAEWPVLMLVGAAGLYLAGRGLWIDRNSGRTWLGLGGASLVMLSASIVVGMIYSFPGAVALSRCVWLGYGYAQFHLALLAAMVMGLWLTSPDCHWRGTTLAPWALCAAVFCLFHVPYSEDTPAVIVARSLGFRHFISLGALHVPLILSMTAALWLGCGLTTRVLAMIMVAIGAVVSWYAWYPISVLTRSAIAGLLLSCRTTENLTRPLWTQYDFVCLFVDPVRLVGPWLLIAVYAWKFPLREPADDGTPFPRIFCNHCLYNLQGLQARRCPECGHPLQLPLEPADATADC